MKLSRPDQKKALDKVEQVTAFMAEMEKVSVTIEITAGMERDLRDLIEAHLWSTEAGLRSVLGAGIGTLLAERVREARTDAEKVRQLTRLLAEAEGRLAAARFELAEAREELRRWELASGAITKIAQELGDTLQRQNRELAALEARGREQERKDGARA